MGDRRLYRPKFRFSGGDSMDVDVKGLFRPGRKVPGFTKKRKTAWKTPRTNTLRANSPLLDRSFKILFFK